MDRVVVLKSIGGSFDRGFQCNLSIATEGQPIDLEVLGTLPAQPDLIEDYRIWQSSYRQLGFPTRISGGGTVHIGKPRTDCKQAAIQLKKHLNQWLQSPSFLPIRDTLLQELQPTDRVRLILQMDDRSLQQLPWHAWELLDRYHQIEIALASPGYKSIKAAKSTVNSVRVLAILGDAAGINIDADRAFLEALPNADVTFLVEPKQHDLSEQLWNQGWDVLFFAGHSITQDSGYLYINPSEKLAIDDLKYALRRSVQQGLQLAIFNSCDGFGLARNLADLHIPQTIFMREPVPDSVAQAFLKHFLKAFVHEAQPLYLAVRSARERLETSEATFLCASWLPMIFQNLAVQPKTWTALSGQPELPPELPPELQVLPAELPPPVPLRSRLQSIAQKTAIVAISSLVTTGLVSWVRHQGWMQPLELKAYDHILQVESVLDARTIGSSSLVITIGDEDKRIYGDPKDDLSVTSENLTALIQKLKKANAEVIAVDLIRDVEGVPKPMVESLRNIDRLIGICSPPGQQAAGFKVPQGIDRHIGFADLASDPDIVVRRHLLTLPNDAICPARQSLSVTAAALYLNRTPEQLLSTIPLMDGKTHPAAYQQTEERATLLKPESYGHLMVHYRGSTIPQMTMADFMKNRAGNVQLAGKVVFIGITRSNMEDFRNTPLATKIPGVFIHAQQTDHLIRMVNQREAPLWMLNEQEEWGWILLWATIAGLMAVLGLPIRSSLQGLHALGRVGIVVLVLYGSCIVMFMQRSGWVPFIPAAASILLTSSVVAGSSLRSSLGSPLRSPFKPSEPKKLP
jgi:CHASE2 domain-containing sensor protein